MVPLPLGLFLAQLKVGFPFFGAIAGLGAASGEQTHRKGFVAGIGWQLKSVKWVAGNLEPFTRKVVKRAGVMAWG